MTHVNKCESQWSWRDQRSRRGKDIGEIIHLELKASRMMMVELGVERKVVSWLLSSVEG